MGLLTNSVGRGGANRREDVKAVQILINSNMLRLNTARSEAGEPPLVTIAEDGRFGNQSQLALVSFQQRIDGIANPNARVEPNSRTLRELLAVLPACAFNKSKLKLIMINGATNNINFYYVPLVVAMAKYRINTPRRQAHFLAQIGHESGSLNIVIERGNANYFVRYEQGRLARMLGNNQQGDGMRFRGRGLIQLTGRANYQDYGNAIGTNLTINNNWESVAINPVLAADVAGWYWQTRNLNPLADQDNLVQITRRINGGLNGLADRQSFFRRAQAVLIDTCNAPNQPQVLNSVL